MPIFFQTQKEETLRNFNVFSDSMNRTLMVIIKSRTKALLRNRVKPSLNAVTGVIITDIG